jgi:hypothetical protein
VNGHTASRVASQPFELLAFQRRFGPDVSPLEDHRSDHIVERKVADADLVQAMAEDFGCCPEAHRPQLQPDQKRSRRIKQRREEPSAQPMRNRCLRTLAGSCRVVKAEREVQE